jgi:Domain of unknown function (DUF4440)
MTHPVLNCEEQRRMAMNNTDLNAFRQFCDAQMTYRHSTGAVDDLAQYISKLETHQVKYSNVIFKDMSVIVPASGDKKVALVMGHMFADVTKPTENIKISSHFQTTWVLDGEQWKLLAVHSASIGH